MAKFKKKEYKGAVKKEVDKGVSKQRGKFVKDTELISKISNMFAVSERQFETWLEHLRIQYGDMRQRKKGIKDRQSNIGAQILGTVVDSFYAHLLDSDFKFTIESLTSADKKKEEMTRSAVMWAFQQSEAKYAINQALRDACSPGEGYLMPYWEVKTDVVKYMNKKGKKEVKFTSKSPGLKYISCFNVIKDNYATDFYKQRYGITRHIIATEELNDFLAPVGVKLTEDDLTMLIDETDAGYFSSREWDAMRVDVMTNGGYGGDDDKYDEAYSFDENEFVEVIRVISKDTMRYLVNGYTVYEGDNPNPLQEVDLIQIGYEPIPGTVFSRGIPDMIKDYEIMARGMLNAFLDNVRLRVPNPMGRLTSTSQIQSMCNIVDLEPGSTIPLEEKDSLFPINLGDLKIDVINIINFLTNLAFQRVGMNDLANGGLLDKVDRSAYASKTRFNSFKVRTLPLFNTLNRGLSRIAKHWIAYMIAFMEDGHKMKIFDHKKNEKVFKELKVEDLMMEFDLTTDAQAMQTLEKESRTAVRIQLLQIVGGLLADPSTGLMRGDVSLMLKEVAQDMGLSDEFVLSVDQAVKNIEKFEKSKLDMQVRLEEHKIKLQEKAQGGQDRNQIQGMMQQAQSNVQDAPPPTGEIPMTGNILQAALEPNGGQ